jgi:hypothetical protein
VFIGSCTNARLPDLQNAAAVRARAARRAGRGRHGGARLSTVKREAEAAGLDRVFRDAGFFWGESGCSMCARQRRSRRARRALRLHHQPQFRASQGSKVRHASRQPGDRRRRARLRAASPTSGNWRGRRDAAVHQPQPASPSRSLVDDLNTDQIAPVQAMRDMKPDYKKLLFTAVGGRENPDFVLNQPQFKHPGMLVSGNNFGAGSSARGGGVGHAGERHPRHRGEELR